MVKILKNETDLINDVILDVLDENYDFNLAYKNQVIYIEGVAPLIINNKIIVKVSTIKKRKLTSKEKFFRPLVSAAHAEYLLQVLIQQEDCDIFKKQILDEKGNKVYSYKIRENNKVLYTSNKYDNFKAAAVDIFLQVNKCYNAKKIKNIIDDILLEWNNGSDNNDRAK